MTSLDPQPSTVAPTRAAATLVLLRPATDGRGGFEVLLTKRPDSMRFGPGMVVFPGGRLEAGEEPAEAAIRETVEETGIEVDPATLLPLSRWVTPYSLPARYDARFFGAIVPAGTDVLRASDEVSSWSWLRPTAALEEMSAGRLAMWLPTVVTLQQLEAVTDAGSLRKRFAPGPPPTVRGEPWRSVATTSAEGIEGRRGTTGLPGSRSWLVIDPPDPTAESIEIVLALATSSAAQLAGVVVTDLRPEHHAGVELFARGLGLPVYGPRGSGDIAPYEVTELRTGELIPGCDVDVRVLRASEPASEPRSWAERAGSLELELAAG